MTAPNAVKLTPRGELLLVKLQYNALFYMVEAS